MKNVDEALERQALIDDIQSSEEARKEWIRDAVINHSRLDVLCEEVLGYKLKPFHKKMQRHTLRHLQTLTLAFRGGGKTTNITVARIILDIIENPNVRILITSKTITFAKDILSEVKGHIEKDEFREIFGDLVGDSWSDSQITVRTRTIVAKEATVSTVGFGGQTVGKHYDKIYSDDLVDESNARTKNMRQQMHTFYYKTLLPTLEPGGELHLLGTRYHPADLYGHLQKNEYRDTTLIIPILDKHGRTPWPEKFTPKEILKRKEAMGLVIFNTQMQCDAEGMDGEIFTIDYMPEVNESDIPSDAQYYMGVDLSTGEGKDFFAMVVVAVSGRKLWVVNHYEKKIRFSLQAKKIAEWYQRYNIVKVGVETVAYQAVLAQTLEEQYPEVTVRRVKTKTDKVTRGIRLAARHEANEVFYTKGNQALISHLVAFPGGDNDDLLDAFYFAYSTGVGRKTKKKKTARKKFGLL